MIRRDAKRQGISYRQFFDLCTFSCNTFQKCETKIQTCPIVNVYGAPLWKSRGHQKNFSPRNRLRPKCAPQAKSRKSLQPQKHKGAGGRVRRRARIDSPEGGIAEPSLRRYLKFLAKMPRAYLFLMDCRAAEPSGVEFAAKENPGSWFEIVTRAANRTKAGGSANKGKSGAWGRNRTPVRVSEQGKDAVVR